MPFVLCADFTIFPDNLQLGPVFSLAAMNFQDLPGGSGASLVNRTNGLNGLQFPDAGIEANLPIPAPWTGMYVGQFNSPVVIEGVDSNGGVITTYAVNKPNSYSFVNLPGGGISVLRFGGGGGEGVIVSICILVP